MPTASDSYEPIDCSLHDRFEAAAVLGDRVRVEWTEPEAESRAVEGTIRDIVVRNAAEYLVMCDGEEVRLDRITDFSTLRQRPSGSSRDGPTERWPT